MHLGLCHDKIEWNFLCVLMCSIFIPNGLGVTAADGLFTEELSNFKTLANEPEENVGTETSV